MIFGIFGRKRKNRAIVDGLYGQLTEAARDPIYYRDMHVPDTVMGRFEMLSLFMVLWLRGARAAGETVAPLAQDMVDTFFEDIDHSIRELGVGDTSVPKRMKKLARMFYGRTESYGAALDNGDEQVLAVALSRNIHPDGEVEGDGMTELAKAIVALDRRFARLNPDDLLSGRLLIPAGTDDNRSDAG